MENYIITKMKIHQSPRRGAYWADFLIDGNERKRLKSCLAQHNGFWVISRPMPYKCLAIRLKQALDVLFYRADALYWRQDHEIIGKSK